ncbi:MAG: MqnA/MqnD/SBP family protein [Planctomycetota bacterium]
MKFGGVSYLNARPLLEGLQPLLLDTPARLSERFRDGEVDVALLPVAAGEKSGRPRVGCLGIAARRPVQSVLLFLAEGISRPEEIRRVRLDPDSRTSRALTMLLLCERWKTNPEIVESGADAELCIGDGALQRANRGEESVDLAEAWLEHTGLPFVFAAWYGDPAAEAELEAAYERGREEIARYAFQASDELGLGADSLMRYLRECIQFRIGDDEEAGLERFLTDATRLGLL